MTSKTRRSRAAKKAWKHKQAVERGKRSAETRAARRLALEPRTKAEAIFGTELVRENAAKLKPPVSSARERFEFITKVYLENLEQLINDIHDQLGGTR